MSKQNQTPEEQQIQTECQDKGACKEKNKKDSKRELETQKQKIKDLEQQIEQQNSAISEANDKYLRLAAEFDNFKKRSQKEKDSIYPDAVCDTVEKLLAVLDNLERAAAYDQSSPESSKDNDGALTAGVAMIAKQFTDILEKMGVTVIPTDIPFDPNLHNAVMHEDNPDLGESVITDVFMKGYQMGEKVIRYSVVKVAN